MAQRIEPSLFPNKDLEAGHGTNDGSQGRLRSSASASELPDAFGTPLKLFMQALQGRNLSPLTVGAYGTDLRQFFSSLTSTNPLLSRIDEVTKDDVHECLAALAKQSRSGVTRARKLASIRELFKFLVHNKMVSSSPAEKVAIPKKEKKNRVYLQPDEYMRILSAAGGNPPGLLRVAAFPPKRDPGVRACRAHA